MPAPDPAALLEHLVDTHWSTAARHAWRLYQERGRGAIVFTVQTDANQQREPLRYLTFTEDADAPESAFAPLRDLVAHYDPRQEVVVAAVLPDGRTVFDVYARTPSPSSFENST